MPETLSSGIEAMQEHAEAASRLLKSLSNTHRLMLLCTLAEQELSVGELNEVVPLSQSALSQHLAILRDQGLVKTRRQSQTIYYSLAETAALDLINTLHDIYCKPRGPC